MSIIQKIENAHMPYLFAGQEGIELLFAKNDGEFQKGNIPIVLWKTYQTKLLSGIYQKVNIQHNSVEDIECSPIRYKTGDYQTILTKDNRVAAYDKNGKISLPVWAHLPYGWREKDFQTWGVFEPNKAIIGWEFKNCISRYEIVGQTQLSIYRIVPIDSLPYCSLVTVLDRMNNNRTLLINHTKLQDLIELKIEGKSVYKSSILGNYCAAAVKRQNSLNRDVIIYDKYELEPISDIKLKLV